MEGGELKCYCIARISQDTVEEDLKALLSYDFDQFFLKKDVKIVKLFLLYDGFYPLENPKEPWDSIESFRKDLEELANNNCRETNLLLKMNKYWNNTSDAKLISTYVQKQQKLYPEYEFIPLIVPFKMELLPYYYRLFT
jgi:hypothetical protein